MDYLVNYEVAIKLKTIGFNAPSDFYYDKEQICCHISEEPSIAEYMNDNEPMQVTITNEEITDSGNLLAVCTAPFIWEVKDYLKDEHGIHMGVTPTIYVKDSKPTVGYRGNIVFTKSGNLVTETAKAICDTEEAVWEAMFLDFLETVK